MGSGRVFAVALLCLTSAGCITVVERPYEEDPWSDERSDQGQPPDYNEVLSPYGDWFYVHGYGRVWRPYHHVVGSDFMPYSTGGQWAYTEVGWVFRSSFSWGYVPFHYGNWHYHGGYGWVWVPGYRWAPAWVYWRSGGGYLGWAPIPPGYGYGYPGYAYGYGYGGYGYVHSHWVFVDAHYVGHPNVHRYRIDPDKARKAFHVATPVAAVRGRPAGPSPKQLVNEARSAGRDARSVAALERLAKGSAKGGGDVASARGAKGLDDGRWAPPPGKDVGSSWAPSAKDGAGDGWSSPPGKSANGTPSAKSVDDDWSTPSGKSAADGWSPSQDKSIDNWAGPPPRTVDDDWSTSPSKGYRDAPPPPSDRGERYSPPSDSGKGYAPPPPSDSGKGYAPPPPASSPPPSYSPPAKGGSSGGSPKGRSSSSRSSSSRSSGSGKGRR